MTYTKLFIVFQVNAIFAVFTIFKGRCS